MNDTRELNLVAGLREHIPGGAGLVEAERQLSAEISAATGAASAVGTSGAVGTAGAAGAHPERHAALKQARRAGSQPRTARGYRHRLAMAGTIAAAIGAAVAVAVAGIQGESADPTANASGRTSPSATHAAGQAIAPRPVSSAAELVAYATQAAAAAPPFDPKPHQWIYAKAVYLYASSARPTGRRISFGAFWERADGREVASRQDGVLHVSSHGVWFHTPGWAAPGWPHASYPYVESLPTSPARLKAIIVANLKTNRNPNLGSGQIRIFNAIGYLMESFILPPKLRVGLYGVLASLPGVHFDRSATDIAGRHGVGLSMLQGSGKAEIVINPKTYAYMGYQDVLFAHFIYKRLIRHMWFSGASAQLGFGIVQHAGQTP